MFLLQHEKEIPENKKIAKRIIDSWRWGVGKCPLADEYYGMFFSIFISKLDYGMFFFNIYFKTEKALVMTM